jgi:DNA-binding transcriptional regulator YdaS (Cro superfamily)
MAREKAKLIRLSEDELQQWEEGARRLGTTASALVRRAVNAALSQQPLLSPAEREELYQAREAFRRAAVNLNGLLHAVHRFDGGALDQLPAAEEFRFMLDDIRTSAARYSDALKKLP